MNWFRFAVLLVITMVLQAGVVDILAFANIKPDLLLILLVFFAVYSDTSDAIITSFATGFAADIIIGSAMGPRTISFGLFGTLLAYLNRVIAIKKMHYQSLAIALVGLLTGSMALFLTLLKDQPIAPNSFTVLLGTSVYSAVVGPFLFSLLSWWIHMKVHRFGRR